MNVRSSSETRIVRNVFRKRAPVETQSHFRSDEDSSEDEPLDFPNIIIHPNTIPLEVNLLVHKEEFLNAINKLNIPEVIFNDYFKGLENTCLKTKNHEIDPKVALYQILYDDSISKYIKKDVLNELKNFLEKTEDTGTKFLQSLTRCIEKLEISSLQELSTLEETMNFEAIPYHSKVDLLFNEVQKVLDRFNACPNFKADRVTGPKIEAYISGLKYQPKNACEYLIESLESLHRLMELKYECATMTHQALTNIFDALKNFITYIKDGTADSLITRLCEIFNFMSKISEVYENDNPSITHSVVPMTHFFSGTLFLCVQRIDGCMRFGSCYILGQISEECIPYAASIGSTRIGSPDIPNIRSILVSPTNGQEKNNLQRLCKNHLQQYEDNEFPITSDQTKALVEAFKPWGINLNISTDSDSYSHSPEQIMSNISEQINLQFRMLSKFDGSQKNECLRSTLLSLEAYINNFKGSPKACFHRLSDILGETASSVLRRDYFEYRSMSLCQCLPCGSQQGDRNKHTGTYIISAYPDGKITDLKTILRGERSIKVHFSLSE